MRRWHSVHFILTMVLVSGIIGGGGMVPVPRATAAPPLSPATPVELAIRSKAAVLMDADSGTVLFEKNSHLALPPASVTKLMPLLLFMEAVDSGKLNLQDQVTASAYAASMGGSQIFLSPGETMTVHELLQATAVASANDATVALAEHLAGTEAQFVSLMNERAQQLGLRETRFANCTGLPVDDHVFSAHDIAVLSRELLRHSKITQYTGLEQGYLRQGSEKPFWLVNTNRLVRFYPGVDGLKTGFTDHSGFCLSATAKRGPLRVIAVVMGEPSAKVRNAEVAEMLDYAFRTYTRRVLYRKGEPIANYQVEDGEPERLVLRAPYEVGVLLKRSEGQPKITTRVSLSDLGAPLKAGQKIGELLVDVGGVRRTSILLQTPVAIQSAGTWEGIKRWFRDLVISEDEEEVENKETA
ncbi:D-alanyl-D-alanine carboxypeptidase family protein [Pasteuria penetrans]|uniref:D-alanyl-D-alanine carboxypeptidase family protein n=1 Tax=Pasteuria penetrans TaxID=86005 RepID=UPI000FA5E3E9|nr:D-alanyl-D-alanine carboxypeptidase family protein [Pasteuria penetrans]